MRARRGSSAVALGEGRAHNVRSERPARSWGAAPSRAQWATRPVRNMQARVQLFELVNVLDLLGQDAAELVALQLEGAQRRPVAPHLGWDSAAKLIPRGREPRERCQLGPLGGDRARERVGRETERL